MEPDRKKKLPEPPVVKEKRQPVPKPGVAGPPGLAEAGYAQQREMLKPSPDARNPARDAAIAPGAGGVAVDERAAASRFPRKAQVIVLEAAVMAKPQFLGQRVALLKRGEEVLLTGREGAWYACVAPNGASGYIHCRRVDKIDIRLEPGETGSGTIRGEQETAGRG